MTRSESPVSTPDLMEVAAQSQSGCGGATCGSSANAASACTNPYPDSKFGVVGPIGSALARIAW